MTTKYLDKDGLTFLWGKLKNYFQPKLVSGTNIKTVNNTSLLGSGNIATLQLGTSSTTAAKGDHTHSGYQATLVSGTNIKTINSTSLLGSGNIATLQLGTTSTTAAKGDHTHSAYENVVTGVTDNQTKLRVDYKSQGTSLYAEVPTVSGMDAKQDTLVSGTNIKTINNESILGSGNISVGGGSSSVTGVKGNAESTYRTGNVNLTPSDLGIGTMDSKTNTKSISSGTAYITSGVSFTLSAGTYILIGQAEFASNATGRRGLVWQQSGNIPHTQVNQTAVSGVATRLQSMCIARPSSSATYTLYASQNSGSALSTEFTARCVKIA